MIDPAVISAAASVVSAIAASVAAVGIWHGIRAMVRANTDRGETMERMMKVDERRHAEAMRALETLIARTAPAPAIRRNRPLPR